ncbi:MAG: CHAT domain-containing protein [Deltaproteobacteria bacterium]|nr:CHAT domain-containing protein [Deltaproteobacteria bacterium]
MRPWLVIAIVIAIVLGAGCLAIPPGSPGTRVAVATMLQHQKDLGTLVKAELDAGRASHAFHVLETAKTRTLASFQLLNRVEPERGERLPDLRPVFANLYQPQSAGDTRGLVIVASAAAPLAATGERADTLFWQEFALVDPVPVHATVTQIDSSAIASIELARLVFPKSSAVASYFVHEDRVYLFWLRRGQLRVYPLETSAATLRDEAAALLAAVRQSPEQRTSAWEPHAAKLYSGLLGPVADQLRRGEIKTLYVSPDQFIANVPFDILLDKGGKGSMLIELVRITRIPSISIHRRMLYRMVNNDEPPRILAVGNPTYPAGVSDLPFAEREATVVSEIFEEAALLTGAAATEARIKELAATYNVLHFATHGVLLGAAVPGGSSLLATAAGDDDGFLSADEISQLDLKHTQLAVLSACETSVSEARGGALDLASLTGAFLTAGVPTVIGTLWHVDDVSTTKLMIGMYSRLHQDGSGEALRNAQLALRGTPLSDPYHWAGFVVYGWGQ